MLCKPRVRCLSVHMCALHVSPFLPRLSSRVLEFIVASPIEHDLGNNHALKGIEHPDAGGSKLISVYGVVSTKRR